MSQFLEVIEWLDGSGTEIVHRVPEDGSGETKLGAQLIVRDSQAAIFFKSGRGLDVFGPGRHTLSTANLPILTKVLSLPWGFTSPFRAEVVFVNRKTFTNLRWGTKDPVAFKDRELGLVRLRAASTTTSARASTAWSSCRSATTRWAPRCASGSRRTSASTASRSATS